MRNLTKMIRHSAVAATLTLALPGLSLAQFRTTSIPRPAPPVSRPSPTPPRTSSSSNAGSNNSRVEQPKEESRATTPVARENAPAPRENRQPDAAPANRPSEPERTAVTPRPEGRPTLVRPAARPVDRPIPGRPGLVTRTSYVGGRPVAAVYRVAPFRGVVYPRYAPVVFYSPGFYGWVLNPWPAPVAFSWGFYGAPWFGFYGAYFTPAPVYVAPELWLTDYVIAQNLQAAYQARANQPILQDAQTSAITPEMKALIAQEIREELATESQEAQVDGSDAPSPDAETAPEALSATQKVFVVSMSLSVTSGTGSCSLTPGDLILRTSDQLSDSQTVPVMVVSSKAGSCPAGFSTALDLATLQAMHNDFRQQIDAGLANLASSQGKNGLPNGPSAQARTSQDGQAQLANQ